MDYKTGYWLEAFNCALEEVDAFNLLTDEQKIKVANSLVTSAECQSMAFGWDAIPDPRNSEVERLKKQHEAELKERDKREYQYRLSVAKRRGVSVSSVYLDNNGDVIIDTRF